VFCVEFLKDEHKSTCPKSLVFLFEGRSKSHSRVEQGSESPDVFVIDDSDGLTRKLLEYTRKETVEFPKYD
jgi:hypothetical protein